jgi:hypothetical protein
LEALSDVFFLVKLLVLPANVVLYWKVIARYKHSSLSALFVSNEEKMFYNIDTSLNFLTSVVYDPRNRQLVNAISPLLGYQSIEVYFSLSSESVPGQQQQHDLQRQRRLRRERWKLRLQQVLQRGGL